MARAKADKADKLAPDAPLAKPTKEKKKRRRKRVKTEIRRLQTGKESTKLLVSCASIERLSREIINKMAPNLQDNLRVEPRALQALQAASEAAITEAFSLANEIAAVCGGRNGPLKRDFLVACRTLPHLNPR